MAKRHRQTRQLSSRYYEKFLSSGVGHHHAKVASQAIARFLCQSIPPNEVQQHSLEICQVDWGKLTA